MVDASQALASWWDANVGQRVGPGVTGLVEALGGGAAGKKALADQMGVTVRTIQRYVRTEAGNAGSNARRPQKGYSTPLNAIRERLAPKRSAIERIKRDGLTISRFAGEMIVSGKSRNVERTPSSGDDHIGGDDLAAFIDAAEAEEWSEAAEEWQRAFFGDGHYAGAYRVPGAELPDITGLDMQIG